MFFQFALFIFIFDATVKSEIPSDFCVGKGVYNRHPKDCNKYVMCLHQTFFIKKCPDSLYWNNKESACDFPSNVECTVDSSNATLPTLPTTEAVTTAQVTTAKTTPQVPVTTNTPLPLVGVSGNCNIKNCNISNRDNDCWCIGENTPGSLANSDTPKMVLISFDDSITENNYQLYKNVFGGRTNPNGCPISVTYFVSHDYTSYTRVKDLYNEGHEIAVHTISHRAPTTWWKYASYDDLVPEIVGMKTRLESKGIGNVVGYRNPFLQTAGDTTFQVLKNNGFLYDSTLPVHLNKNWWPYTLDYGGPKHCIINPCPRTSFPGLWEVPMLEMKDTVTTCSMFDGCQNFKNYTKEAVYDFFKTNFDRHYARNTAPFPMFTHAAWMQHIAFGYRKEGFGMFLDYLKERKDVYIVSIQKSIEWIRNPIKIADIKQTTGPFSCQSN